VVLAARPLSGRTIDGLVTVLVDSLRCSTQRAAAWIEPFNRYRIKQPNHRSEGVEKLARKRIKRLSTLSDRIVAGRVTIEARQRAGHKITTYGARIELSLAGGSIVVGTRAAPKYPRGRVQGALRGAFDAVERRLGRYQRSARLRTASSGGQLGN
jgi:hypothetical protein